MKLLKKLLVSIDFSDQSQDVVNQAGRLAKLFKSQLILLHVVPTAISKACDLDNLLQPATQALEDVRRRLQQEGAEIEASHVICAEPFEEIINQAERYRANLILMGGKDYEPDGDTGVGVTTWRVIRKSQKPVWVVKPKNAHPLSSILCAVDYSEASQRALKSALTLARTSGAKLHVLHVNDNNHQLPGHYEPLTAKEKIAIRQQVVQDQLDDFLRSFDTHQVLLEKHLIAGDPRQAIMHAADLLKADLVMLGSIGQNESAKLLLGAVAEAVVKTSPISFITFKKEHAIALEVDNLLVSITDHFTQGKELLENGLADEAISFFEHCLNEDKMFLPAWEGLAEAYHRIGQQAEAQKVLETIDALKKRFWEKRVEFELKHRFWKKS